MFHSLIEAFTWFAFPSGCSHCHSRLDPGGSPLCRPCSELLELIDPQLRCRLCFSPIGEQCPSCAANAPPWHGYASAFDYEGPAASLVKQMKYRNSPYLAKSLAAFLVAQLDQLAWPLPDLLIPVPMPYLRQLSRGYNQAELLAEELGHFLGRPTVRALKRALGTFSQAGLSLEQRKSLPMAHFAVKAPVKVYGRHLLLVDDVMTTGSTLKACALALSRYAPKRIYALTVCRT